MSEPGDSPRVANQGDGTFPVQPGFGDLDGSLVSQVKGKNLTRGLNLTGPDQPLREMFSTERCTREHGLQRAMIDR